MQNAYIVPRGQSLDEIYIEGRILRIWLWAFAWHLDLEGAPALGQGETILYESSPLPAVEAERLPKFHWLDGGGLPDA